MDAWLWRASFTVRYKGGFCKHVISPGNASGSAQQFSTHHEKHACQSNNVVALSGCGVDRLSRKPTLKEHREMENSKTPWAPGPWVYTITRIEGKS
jgi:hypothetical protein